MKFTKLSDINKLPSVLDSHEFNLYMAQLLDFIEETDSLNVCQTAYTIWDLITYQDANSEGLNSNNSKRIFKWVKGAYDSKNIKLVKYSTSLLANLNCENVKEYLLELVTLSKTEEEKKELEETLAEINEA